MIGSDLELCTIRTLINAYKIPEVLGRNDIIETLLLESKLKNAALSWLNEHNQHLHFSPTIYEIKNKIELNPPKATPDSKGGMIHSIYLGILKLTPFKNVDCEEVAQTIEKHIISKDLPSLFHYATKNKTSFIHCTELLKLHLHLQTLTIEDLAYLLTRKDNNGNMLLETLPTEQLVEILKLHNNDNQTVLHIINIANWNNKQILRLCSLASLVIYNHSPRSISYEWKKNLPPFALQFLEIINQPNANKPTLEAVKKKLDLLPDLSDQEKYSALAHYIEYEKKPLNEFIDLLSEDDFIALSPFLYYIDLKSFKNVELGREIIRKCNNPFYLCINNAEMINTFDSLPKCVELNCKGTSNISDLPAIPSCLKLDCSKCPYLCSLPKMPLCKIVHCANCQSLTELPELPRCQELVCSQCKFLRKIPDLPICKKLECQNNPLITELLPLPMCIYLNCSKCVSLQRIKTLPICRIITCSLCPKLEELPDIPMCTMLDCNNCPLLLQLPKLDECEYLNCSSCSRLVVIPPLPKSIKLNCSNCMWLGSLPTVSARCQEVDFSHCPGILEYGFNNGKIRINRIHSGLDHENPKLIIDIKDITTNPKKVLKRVGILLFANHPLWNVYYVEEGVLSPSIDEGGVTRDLIARLFRHLFIEKELISMRSKNYLIIDEGFPVADDTNDQKHLYEILGLLFAMCCSEEAQIKIGPIFSDEFYKCLIIDQNPSLQNEDWLLNSFFVLKNIPESLNWLIKPQNKKYTLNSREESYINYLAEQFHMPLHTDEKPYTYIEWVQLRLKLVQEAKNEKRLQTICWIAKKIKARTSTYEWNKLISEGATLCKLRIEGSLDIKKLIDQLKWERRNGVSLDKFLKTKEYLTHWIQNADEKTLRLFLIAVTSVSGLGDKCITIKILNKDANFIPTAHTCALELFLSGSYPTQKHFNEKLNILLSEGLAGTGFQIL